MVLATVYTMGYDFTVIAETEKEAERKLLKECRRCYKSIHGCTITQREEKEYIRDLIDYNEIELNKVIVR